MKTKTEIELAEGERIGTPTIFEANGRVYTHVHIHAAERDSTIRGGFEFCCATAAQARALAEGFARYAERMETREAAACPDCNGTGAAGDKTVYPCGFCHGTGRVVAGVGA